MNARSHVFELSVEGRQIEEVVESIFHTLLFHRTLGKVRVASDELARTIKREILGFRDVLRNAETGGTGQISLEFYQKKRARWPFPAECIPWEVWTIKLDVIQLANEHERQICREKVSELVEEKILYIADNMNRHEYIPKMPNQSDLDLVFDTACHDVQPYLFKISYQTMGPTQTSVGTTMRKFIKDTLAL